MHGWMMCDGLQAWSGGAWPLIALWVTLRVAMWALIVTAIIFAIRWLRRGSAWYAIRTPGEILKVRYARGELSREQFEAMKRDLDAS